MVHNESRIARWLSSLSLLVCFSISASGQNLISTIAGNGVQGSSGDGGAALNAALNTPWGVAADRAGNIYVSEFGGHRIRRINAAGIISTYAGTGTAGYAGDGGPATAAQLNAPQGLALDPEGNLYIADYANHRVRKVGTNGRIVTVAGNGQPGYGGNHGPATSATVGYPTGLTFDAVGNLYIASRGIIPPPGELAIASSVRRVTPSGIIDILLGPTFVPVQYSHVAVDPAGTLYSTDPPLRIVHKLTSAGAAPATFAGTGTAGSSGDGGSALSATLTSPTGILLDTTGNLYISDPGANVVRRVGTDGIIRRLAGTSVAGFTGDGLPGLLAQLNQPVGMALDASGALLIADSGNHRVRRITILPVCDVTLSSNLATFYVPFSGGNVLAGTLQTVPGCAWNAVTDSSWLAVSPAGGTGNTPITFTVAPNNSGAVRTAQAVMGSLRVTIVQPAAPCTYSVSPTSQVFTSKGGSGTIRVTAPDGCPWTASSNASFVSLQVTSSAGSGSIEIRVAENITSFTREAQLIVAGVGVTITQAGNCPYSLSPTNEARSGSSSRRSSFNIVTGAGCTWAASSGDGWITVDPETRSGRGNTRIFFDVAANRTGSTRTGKIQAGDQTYTVTQAPHLVPSGGLITTLAGDGTPAFSGDGGPSVGAQLRQATGIAVDKYGNIYFADSENHRVRKIDPFGVIATIAGTGSPGFSGDGGPAVNAQLNTPYSVAVDSDGRAYIADQKNYRIRRVDTNGTISTVAGTGVSGYSGDGGPAIQAQISDVYGISIGPLSPTLYIADRTNNRIRSISNGTISTIAGNGQFGFSGDGGLGTSASLALPEGVAASLFYLYIADTANNRVRRVDFNGTTMTTLAGNGAGGFGGDGGAAGSGTLSLPRGVAAVTTSNGDNVYIADSGNNRIRSVIGGTITTIAGNGTASFSGDGGPATNAAIREPRSLAIDGDEDIFIADIDNFRIRAASQVPCFYRLVPASRSYVPSGGTGGFEVFTQDGCPWTATVTVPWIVLTSNASGRGNGVVFYSFAANASPSSRTGTITVADQTFTVNQEGPPANLNLTSFEPKLVRTLEPGFYILEASLATGALGGAWGLEVVSSAGQAPGGFNLGGGLAANASTPGFGAFLINTTQTVTATLNAQTSTGTVLTLRYLDANRRQVGTPVTGLSPLRLTQSLTPGFYIVEVYSSGPAPFNFQLGLAADFFVGGVNTGGFIGQGSVGFGAFYISDTQEVTMKLYGRTTYGPNGAGDLILTLRDSNRNVITTVTPP